LLAVADGVGGEAGGEVASGAAIDALAARFFGAGPGTAPADALTAAMRGANDAVIGAARASGQHGAASTLVAAAVADRDAVIGNLGDSRAYLLRDGQIRRLTADHSGDYPSSITRFVGDPRGIQPDVFVETLRSGDRLLLCSDGLTRHVAPEEIARTVARADPARAAQQLVGLANARGGEDNVTVVVYEAPRSSSLLLAVLSVIVVLAAAGAAIAYFSPAPVPPPSASPSSGAPASPSEAPSPSATASPSATP
jgi:protein phosphatase